MVIGLPIIIVFLVCLFLSACSSATEASMLALNKVRLRHLKESGNRSAKLTFDAVMQIDQVIGTLLIVNNLTNVAVSAIGTWICVAFFGPQIGLPVATGLVTVIVLLLCEVTPKMYAASHAERVAFSMIRPLRMLMASLSSCSRFLTWFARTFLKLFGVQMGKRSPLVTEEEIKVMIQMGREAGVLAEDELHMLQRIFEFSDAVVSQVMIPREKIAGVNLEAQPEEALDVVIEEGYSRIPVYRQTLDAVVGVIYARDLLAQVRHGGLLVLSDLIRPITVVPEHKRIAELLSEFQRTHTQIAIVQSTQKKTIGIVTMEDLMEEIVGEIEENLPPRRKRSA